MGKSIKNKSGNGTWIIDGDDLKFQPAKKKVVYLTKDQKIQIYNLYWTKKIKNKKNFIGKKYNVSARTIYRLFKWFKENKDNSITQLTC